MGKHDWKVGYRKALMEALIRDGGVVSSTPSHYSTWQDYARSGEIFEHMKSCTVDLDRSTELKDSEWQEFMGTFYEGDETVHGVDAYVSCSCGEYYQIPMRMTGTFGELVKRVLED